MTHLRDMTHSYHVADIVGVCVCVRLYVCVCARAYDTTDSYVWHDLFTQKRAMTQSYLHQDQEAAGGK